MASSIFCDFLLKYSILYFVTGNCFDDNPCYPGVQCRLNSYIITCGSCPSGFTGSGFTCSPLHLHVRIYIFFICGSLLTHYLSYTYSIMYLKYIHIVCTYIVVYIQYIHASLYIDICLCFVHIHLYSITFKILVNR